MVLLNSHLSLKGCEQKKGRMFQTVFKIHLSERTIVGREVN